MLIRRADTQVHRFGEFQNASIARPTNAQAAAQSCVDTVHAGTTTPEADTVHLLSKQVEDLQAELAQEKASRASATDAALEKGRKEGRRQAESSHAERLRALRDALITANSDLPALLAAKGDLAIVIAQSAIQKVLGDTTSRAQMVADAARQAVSGLASNAVVRLRVSAEDFSSQEASFQIAGLQSVDCIACDDLPGGSCLIDLEFGAIDASLPLQASSLARALDECALPSEKRGL